MLADFIDTWSLFYASYLVGFLLAGTLASVGVLVVARDQIFIGAAMAQASTLGIALGLWLGAMAAASLPWLGADWFLSLLAVVFSVGAALLATRGGEKGRESHEAVTGWVFLASASLAILVVARSPHGLDEVHRLLSSSIIGAADADIAIYGLLAAGTAAGLAVLRRPLLLAALDPAMAVASGIRVRAWNLLSAAWLGLVIGLAIKVSGMLFSFGCLVLPALVAKNLCREIRTMFGVAPLVAVGAAAVGFVLAHGTDSPPAQMTVALLSAALLAAWGVRALRSRHHR
jgi:ABC-type Mn2+/Zn2+ transport system permease subunit